MILTEDEAKTKWCPFSCTGYHGIGLNRLSLPIGGSREQREIIHDTRCIASGCMMWVVVGAQSFATSPGTCGLIHTAQRL